MKKNLNFNSRLKKEVLKAFFRFYYFFQANFLKFKFNILKKKTLFDLKKISLLCPTKNRSIKFKRMAETLIDKTKNPKNIELLVCFDLIENQKKSYLEIFNMLSNKGFVIKNYFTDLKTHAERNNFLASKSLGDFMFPINDDLIFITKYWDEVLINEFSVIQDKQPFCLWVNCDRKYKYLDYSAFPIINRDWYNCLGYIVPEFFIFWYLDWWICEVSRLSKKYFLSKIKIYQFHPESFPAEIDLTYKNNATSEKLKKDYSNWLNTKKYRIKDLIKIKSKIY